MSNERRRFRAAGQAVAALWLQVPIAEVDKDGIAIGWAELPIRDRPRAEVLAEIGVGLAGIAAVSAYGFGRLQSCENICTWNFSIGEIEDFTEVQELIDAIDPGDTEDLLMRKWIEAIALMNRPGLWRAVTAIAGALRSGGLTQQGVEDRAAGALWIDLLFEA